MGNFITVLAVFYYFGGIFIGNIETHNTLPLKQKIAAKSGISLVVS